jgi:hypothetical protein
MAGQVALPTFLRRLNEQFTVVLWICLGSLLLFGLIILALPFDVDGTDDIVTSVITVLLILIGLTAAICIRYMFDRKAPGAAFGNKPWAVIWLFPLAVTVLFLPWLLSGALADESTSVFMSLVLWLLIAYVALLLGFLFIPFVILPLELIGRGILALISGRHKEAAPMLVIGLYIALVTAFAFVGAFAIENPVPGKLGWGNVIFALIGLPASYTIENQALLWVARAMAVVLIAVPVAYARLHRPQAPTDQRVSRTQA